MLSRPDTVLCARRHLCPAPDPHGRGADSAATVRLSRGTAETRCRSFRNRRFLRKSFLRRFKEAYRGENFLRLLPPTLSSFRCSMAFLVRLYRHLRLCPILSPSSYSSECNFFFPLARSGYRFQRTKPSSNAVLTACWKKAKRTVRILPSVIHKNQPSNYRNLNINTGLYRMGGVFMRTWGECLCVDKSIFMGNHWKFLDLPGGSVYAWTSRLIQALLWITFDGHVSAR